MKILKSFPFVGVVGLLVLASCASGTSSSISSKASSKVEDGSSSSPESSLSSSSSSSSLAKYTITFVDEDGTSVLQTGLWTEGEIPTCPEPSKAEDDQYTYSFASWSPEVVPVVADATYTAVYNQIQRVYMITFENDDGSLIKKQTYTYGEIPSCDRPSKATDTEYSYTWGGWQPAIVNVVGDAVYKASFLKTTYPSTDGLIFSKNADGVSCTLTGIYNVDASVKNIVVPSLYQGLTVTSIGENSFGGTSATSVTLPPTITTIQPWAFHGCNTLTSVTLPSSLTSIGNLAFYGCTGLTTLVIPDSVTTLGQSAFDACTGLTSVTLPSALTSLSKSLFEGCTGLTSMVIPEGVTSLEDYAFDGCTGLTTVNLPDSLTHIGEQVFDQCTSLTYNVKNNVNYLGNSTHPYLAAVGASTSITSVTLEAGCKFVLDCAFDVFANATVVGDLANITLPDSLLEIGYAAFAALDITSLTLPSNLVYVASEAFSYCRKLTSISVPVGVTSLSEKVFEDCTALQSVSLLGVVTNFGASVFMDDAVLATLNYAGTMDQFNAATKDGTWNKNCTVLKSVVCSDGTVTL
jgi:hypothetical protein